MKGNTRRWKDLPGLCISRINIVKMAILPKAIYTNTIKIPLTLFTETKRNTKIHMKQHKTQKSKSNPEQKEQC
jgi:hypothetical protein